MKSIQTSNIYKIISVLLIFILLIILLLIIYSYLPVFRRNVEGLTNNNAIILLGDSILNNSLYVPFGKSVYDDLTKKTKNAFIYARDNSTIFDVYSQLNDISSDLNKPSTYIFLSAGGNDILMKGGYITDAEVNELFTTYEELVKQIKNKFNKVQIVLLNLYLPYNPNYSIYKKAVEKWNKFINTFVEESDGEYQKINLQKLLFEKDDFVHSIEPSILGSQKIADAIYQL